MMKREKKWRRVAYVVSLVLLVWIWFQPKLNGSDNPEQQAIHGEHWGITGERGAREAEVDQCEGTDDLIYITYSLEPYIDVYDHGGTFLYSIMLPDAQNGAVAIDCRDGILIAESKTNTVFLFRGTELVEQMEHDKAKERGLCPDRINKESDYVITQTHVARVDGEELFELPPEIRENLSWDRFLTKPQRQVTGTLFLVLFAAAWLTVVGTAGVKIWRGFREDRARK